MRNLVRALLIAVFLFAGSAWAVETGYVHAISGEVTITRAGMAPVRAKLGDLFEEGTSFATGADGKAVLKFADGQVVSLSPRTQFAVTSYVYDKNNAAQGNILFSLARGGMRFVTGLIGQTNKSRFAIRTPTLTAGVRGTDGIIVVSDDGSTLVTVLDGVVTITTSAGTVVINKDSYAFYPPGALVPSASGPASNMPPAAFTLLQTAAGLINTDLPPPDPVDVIQAAKDVVDAAAGGGPVTPTPTPGPAGGGGGGVGVSPS
jgi:uncharacterized cupin superfamily protein